MAPRPTAQRRSAAQSEAFHDLGVRGRKTGVYLKDTGERDEHGMQPLDDVFSSPEKESQNGVDDYDDDGEGESEEEPMDIDETTGPAPSEFMNGTRYPPARARSPPKTSLGSSPRRNPHLGRSSSPIRGSIVSPQESPQTAKSVNRRLDFKNNLLANKPNLAAKTNGTNGVNGSPSQKGKKAATTNGHRSPPEEEEYSENEEESMAMLDAAADDYAVDDEEDGGEEAEALADDTAVEEEEEQVVEEEEQVEEEEEAPAPATNKRKGRPKKAPPVEDEPEGIIESIEDDVAPEEDREPAHAGRKRGRPAKNKVDNAEKQPAKKRAKTTSNVEDEAVESLQQAPAAKVKGRKPGQAAAAKAAGNKRTSTDSLIPAEKPAIPKQKRGAGKRTSTGVGDTSLAEVPRGPPLPKSRGLMITRRETPDGFTTRSGRTSYQPLKFWKNERAELDSEEIFDDGKGHILLPRIREIVRVDDPEPDSSKKSTARRKGGRTGGRRRGGRHGDDSEDEAELEPWEQDGDVVTGEVAIWQPEHEFNPPGPDEQIEVAEEQIAVSAGAIVTREIRNASFRFAKTLSTPFFGSGVVDLPPHSEKKPKNSRKMHMTFFVFSGRVDVTVADTTFRIGKGGMWFVPRGNYYSIDNGYDQPARVFFAQGCEVSSMAGENSMVA